MSVLVDDAAESVLSAYPQALKPVGIGDRLRHGPQGRGLSERPAGAVHV